MADVFVDYEPNDSGLAREIATELTIYSLSCFLVERLAPADRSTERLALEAGKAQVIVLLWSAAAASALQSRGMLERTAAFIRYWSEERLIVARLDETELPFGLRDVPSIPPSVLLWDKVARAANEIIAAGRPGSMMDLGDHDWQGVTQVWTDARPGIAPDDVRSAELGDHEWQGATQASSATPAPASPALPPAPVDNSLFVSYAHSDLSSVDPIVGEISALGFPVWIDRAEMSSAAGWAGQITRAVKASRAVVLMASTAAYASDHVVREMYLAMNAKKKIVPIELEPAAMTDEFEYILAPFQRFTLAAGSREAVLSRALKTV